MAPENRLRILAELDDKISSKLAAIRDKFDTLGKSKGAQSILQGVGVGAGVSAFGLLDRAISGFIDVAGDAVQSALADEESQNRLAASLRANVPNWDGNTDAIERNIVAAQRLGFDDETLRDSLTVLAGATHDVGKAQEYMSTAMDLARFKGVDLRTASEALIKVSGGHYRALAQLGIKLREGATSTEALAAVQKVAAGQAEAYAQTNSGRLLASQIRLDEAMENFGTNVMPLAIDSMVAAADAATTLVGTLDDLTHVTQLTNDEQVDLSETLLRATANVPLFGKVFEVMADQVAAGQDEIAARSDHSRDAIENLHGTWITDMGEMEEASKDWRDTFRTTTTQVGSYSEKVRGQLAEDAQGVIDEFFDPIEARAAVFEAHEALRAAQDERRNARSKADKRAAANAAIEALDDEGTALVELGRLHGLTEKDVKTFERNVRANYGTMSKDAQAKMNAMLDKLRALARFKGDTIPLTVVLSWIDKADAAFRGGKRGQQEFAGGGFVQGPPGSRQAIIAHAGEHVDQPGMYTLPGAVLEALASSSGGGGGLTVNFNSIWPPTPQQAQEIARIIGEEQYYNLQRAAPSRGAA